jgi:acetylornithine/N-succinyldiaminopimelate aminotransferase
MTAVDLWQERAEKVLMQTYLRQPVAIASGRGCRVTDVEGREYLDLLAGIAVNVLGHAHPAVAAAAGSQLGKLVHTSNLYYTEPQLELAEKLTALAFASRVFFCNSGAEANETAIKSARKWGREHGGAAQILCLQGAFHGRTMGSLSATYNPRYQEPFTPLLTGFAHVPPNDLPAMEAAVTKDTVAIMLEPILGESGVIPLDDEYLAGIRKLCDERNLLLIVDEVQTGMGRTGKWWAYQHTRITPDIMTVAKGLGGGLPIGAVLAGPRADVLAFGDHGSTFGGNPVVCAAALAVIETIAAEDLPGNAARMGGRLRDRIAGIDDKVIAEVRGRGLMLGIRLRDPIAPKVVAAAVETGVLINATDEHNLRLVPPLNITGDEVDEAAGRLGEAVRMVMARS